MSNIDKISQKIMDEFNILTHGIRVVMLIDRSVGNTNKGSRRWINKIITYNQDSFRDGVNTLLEMQYYLNNHDLRMYACVNDRNIDRAIKTFQHKQLDISTIEEKVSFYTKINNSFCSCIMKPENRNSSHFLLDLDQKDTSKLYYNLHHMAIEPLLKYESVKGWHYIVKPFNPILLEVENCEIKKDALLLLNWIGKYENN